MKVPINTFIPKDDDYLYVLKLYTKILRGFSLIIILGTVFNIFSFIYIISFFKYRLHGDSPFEVIITFVICPFSIMIALFLWEQTKNKGMIIFEEISDEMEWSHRTFRNVKKDFSDSLLSDNLLQKPPIEIRLTLRMFIDSTKLPLAPERNGTSFYFLIQLIFIILFSVYIMKPF